MDERIIKEKYLPAITNHIVNLIRFKSVHNPSPHHKINLVSAQAPYGQETHKALTYMLDLGAKLGFKSTIGKDNKYGYIEYGTGQELFGIICHLDVVPAGDVSKWISDPWTPWVDQTKIWGRGALDNKGPAVVNLFALKYLKDTGYEPQKYTIRLVFGLTEETTWESITAYKKNESDIKHGYVPDGQWPVIHAEKRLINFDIIDTEQQTSCHYHAQSIPVYNVSNGSVTLSTNDDHLLNKIISTLREHNREFIFENQEITVKGHAVHGSVPETGMNALLHLAQAIPREQQSNLFQFINRNFQDQPKWHVKLFDNVCDQDNKVINFHDESGVISLSLSFIEATDKVQKIGCDARIPVTITDKQFMSAINQGLKPFPTLQYQLIDDIKGKLVPTDSQVITTLMRIYQEATHDTKAQPLAIGGASYARNFDALVAFGACDSVDSIHGVNECLLIKDLIKMFLIYTQAIKTLTA